MDEDAGPQAHLRLGGQLDHRLPEVQLGVCGPHVDGARSGLTPDSDSAAGSGCSSSSSSAAPAALRRAELRTPPAAGVGPAPVAPPLDPPPRGPASAPAVQASKKRSGVEPNSWSSFCNQCCPCSISLSCHPVRKTEALLVAHLLRPPLFILHSCSDLQFLLEFSLPDVHAFLLLLVSELA